MDKRKASFNAEIYIQNNLTKYLIILILLIVCLTGCNINESKSKKNAEIVETNSDYRNNDNTTKSRLGKSLGNMLLYIVSTHSGYYINTAVIDDALAGEYGKLSELFMKNTLANEGCLVCDNAVDVGLYEFTIDEISGRGYINSIKNIGEDILVIYENEQMEYYLYKVNPFDKKLLSSVKLASGYYMQDCLFIGEDNHLAVWNDTGMVTYLDSELKVEKELKLDIAWVDNICFSDDLSRLYYFDGENRQLCSYNVETETSKAIMVNDVFTENESITLLGLNDKQNQVIIYVWDYLEDKNTSKYINIDTGLVEKEIDIQGSKYAIKDNRYITSNYVDGLEEIYFGDLSENQRKVLALEKYSEYSCVSKDIYNQVVITTINREKLKDKTKNIEIGLYDLNAGNKRYKINYCLGEEYIDKYFNAAQYISEKNSIVLFAEGERPSFYVLDLAEQEECTEKLCYVYEENMDIAELKKKAETIGKKYNVEIYIGDEIKNCKKDIYEYVPNYNPVRIDRSLDILDNALGRYPKDFFKQLSQGEGGVLKIFFSGDILAADETAITTAVGVQNTWDNETYLVLDITSIGDYETTIYHEVYHAIENYLSGEGYYFDYDRWNSCNPQGFDYDYDYIANVNNFDMSYTLIDESNEVYFVDTYSKSFPSEDRARIMEYAMMESENNTEYFENKGLSDKLAYMSELIREGFDDKTWSNKTEWEAVYIK